MIQIQTISRTRYPSGSKYLDVSRDTVDQISSHLASESTKGSLTEELVDAYHEKVWELILTNGLGKTPHGALSFFLLNVLDNYRAGLRRAKRSNSTTSPLD